MDRDWNVVPQVNGRFRIETEYYGSLGSLPLMTVSKEEAQRLSARLAIAVYDSEGIEGNG